MKRQKRPRLEGATVNGPQDGDFVFVWFWCDFILVSTQSFGV